MSKRIETTNLLGSNRIITGGIERKIITPTFPAARTIIAPPPASVKQRRGVRLGHRGWQRRAGRKGIKIKSGQPLQRRAVDMLELLRSSDQPLTRREIARQFGKPYLMRYDIECLVGLIERGLVIEETITRAELFHLPKPENFRGRNIALAAFVYTYQVNPYYLKEIARLIPPPPPRPTRTPEPPLYTYDDSILGKIKRRLGF
jgi:hypothetical protein